jgi:hypothetical protein
MLSALKNKITECKKRRMGSARLSYISTSTRAVREGLIRKGHLSKELKVVQGEPSSSVEEH